MSCCYFCLPFAKFNLPMKNKMEKITLRNLRKIKIKSKSVDMFCYFYNIKINYQTILSLGILEVQAKKKTNLMYYA